MLHSGLIDVQHTPVEAAYGPPPPPALPLEAYLQGRPRDERRVRRHRRDTSSEEVGVNRIIRVVSTGDLTFPLDEPSNSTAPTLVVPIRDDANSLICMTTPGFAVTLVVLLGIMVVSCLVSTFLCVRLRPCSKTSNKNVVSPAFPPAVTPKKSTKSCCFS